MGAGTWGWPHTMAAPVSISRPRRLIGHPLVVAVLAASLFAFLPACRGGPSLSADTAKVTIDGDRLTFTLDDCGRDGAVVFLLGQTSGAGGAVLQAVVGLSAPRQSAEPRPVASGFSVVFGPDRAVGAFGEEAARNVGASRAIGKIDRVRIDGSRVRMSVELEQLDRRNQPTGGDGGTGTLDANCGPGSDI